MSSEQNDPKWRKQRPVFSGVLMYFPDALREVAHCSYMGNEQHHPGEPLHWDRSKSTDEADACVRHLMEAGTVDTDGVRHSAKAAWRALALLQKEIELERLKTSTNHAWNNPKPVPKEALALALQQMAEQMKKQEPTYKLSDFHLDSNCGSSSMYCFTPTTLSVVDPIAWEDAEGDPNYWGV